jgi:hypothetical protein
LKLLSDKPPHLIASLSAAFAFTLVPEEAVAFEHCLDEVVGCTAVVPPGRKSSRGALEDVVCRVGRPRWFESVEWVPPLGYLCEGDPGEFRGLAVSVDEFAVSLAPATTARCRLSPGFHARSSAWTNMAPRDVGQVRVYQRQCHFSPPLISNSVLFHIVQLFSRLAYCLPVGRR